ncbi:mitogen-activated protein kinase kinase kinase 20-like [Euphorbia lathyris]|uniref:mitogen-activated protein kinase kinase kinase 20-like n=1 Tax=Euphorbia lathyris TaxID=212925 RepID=UPI00331387BD
MKRKFDSEHLNGGEEEPNLYNHGVAWFRGRLLGKGGFGSVYLAELKNPNSPNMFYPELMAIKSAEISASSSLQKEKQVLNNLVSCPYILECYGEEMTTTKNGQMVYNVLLEYASGGTLGSLIKQSGGLGLPESNVRRYTRCILKGLDYIHSHGYVHCDLKPDNILMVSGDENKDSFVPKIGDFGLAKRNKNIKFDPNHGGTALYMAPETVMDRIQEPPCDIWGLGCIVFEMLTGKKVWNPDMKKDEIFEKISDPNELPKITPQISDEGKDFMKRCFARNPMFRSTARKLLIHPFILASESYDEERVSSLSNSDDERYSSSCSEDWSFTSDGEEGYTYDSPSQTDDG